MTELRRDLGLAAALAIVIGTVIGSGIFRVPQTMIQSVGSVHMVFLVWVVGGALSLAGALTYAELAAALPGAGGEYVYLTEAYGPMWGYLYSWTQLSVAKSGSIATLATAFFEYTAHFIPEFEKVWVTIGPFPIKYGQIFALVLILTLGMVNYFGVRIGGNVQIAVTVVKVALIAFVIVAGLLYSHPTPAALPLAAPPLQTGFIAALVAALWAYDGWNNVGMVASEIRNPKRNLPLALIAGTVIVIAIYMLANWAYFRVLTPAEVAGHKLVAAEMMQRVQGPAGAAAVSMAAMISIFAALNGSILSGARVPYAAARDGLFFKSAARVHPAFHTPGVSIMMLTGWSCVLVLSGKYDDLYNFVIFGSWILYAMATASVFVLRRKRPDLPRPYKTLGYPVVPALFLAGAALLEIRTLIDKPQQAITGIVLMLLGLPFYFYWRKRAAKAPQNVPQIPINS
ncbi:MAG: basic amino acid/polyamine antiporter, family [Bryobacterales bacterium]|jgi:amino acid transporter|nr:basic amino acid/polyamine antiporter, family [Bryobacterales bacterium]